MEDKNEFIESVLAKVEDLVENLDEYASTETDFASALSMAEQLQEELESLLE